MYLWKNFFSVQSSFKMQTFCIWLLEDFRIKMKNVHLNNLQNEGVKDEVKMFSSLKDLKGLSDIASFVIPVYKLQC